MSVLSKVLCRKAQKNDEAVRDWIQNAGRRAPEAWRWAGCAWRSVTTTPGPRRCSRARAPAQRRCEPFLCHSLPPMQNLALPKSSAHLVFCMRAGKRTFRARVASAGRPSHREAENLGCERNCLEATRVAWGQQKVTNHVCGVPELECFAGARMGWGSRWCLHLNIQPELRFEQ